LDFGDKQIGHHKRENLYSTCKASELLIATASAPKGSGNAFIGTP